MLVAPLLWPFFVFRALFVFVEAPASAPPPAVRHPRNSAAGAGAGWQPQRRPAQQESAQVLHAQVPKLVADIKANAVGMIVHGIDDVRHQHDKLRAEELGGEGVETAIAVQDVGLREVDDPAILDWAADNERILLTHDRVTMPDFAYERLVRGEQMTGLFVVND